MLSDELIKTALHVVAPFIAAIVAIIGWLATSMLNRKNEIFKQILEERLKRRMMMFESVFEALLPFANPRNGELSVSGEKLSELLSMANKLVQLYGNNCEIDCFRKFTSAINGKDLDLVKKLLIDELPLFRENMREELGYGSL
ncbi:MAG TPA: hypothetical protein VM661_17940 [Candidatus Sulfotelmatobacter sp.]|jgi:hypothetical protein|nr:hypothetical protein [Candidatus Sulfotelmatobacter sp.]